MVPTPNPLPVPRMRDAYLYGRSLRRAPSTRAQCLRESSPDRRLAAAGSVCFGGLGVVLVQLEVAGHIHDNAAGWTQCFGHRTLNLLNVTQKRHGKNRPTGVSRIPASVSFRALLFVATLSPSYFLQRSAWGKANDPSHEWVNRQMVFCDFGFQCRPAQEKLSCRDSTMNRHYFHTRTESVQEHDNSGPVVFCFTGSDALRISKIREADLSRFVGPFNVLQDPSRNEIDQLCRSGKFQELFWAVDQSAFVQRNLIRCRGNLPTSKSTDHLGAIRRDQNRPDFPLISSPPRIGPRSIGDHFVLSSSVFLVKRCVRAVTAIARLRLETKMSQSISRQSCLRYLSGWARIVGFKFGSQARLQFGTMWPRIVAVRRQDNGKTVTRRRQRQRRSERSTSETETRCTALLRHAAAASGVFDPMTVWFGAFYAPGVVILQERKDGIETLAACRTSKRNGTGNNGSALRPIRRSCIPPTGGFESAHNQMGEIPRLDQTTILSRILDNRKQISFFNPMCYMTGQAQARNEVVKTGNGVKVVLDLLYTFRSRRAISKKDRPHLARGWWLRPGDRQATARGSGKLEEEESRWSIMDQRRRDSDEQPACPKLCYLDSGLPRLRLRLRTRKESCAGNKIEMASQLLSPAAPRDVQSWCMKLTGCGG
ncbi:hypothetical protein DFH06DRAFT_1124511 [Mycena polygramma]|nr:hypothetical protein DFH06DRAFT_1124511 [Mycena polygramma]